MLSETLKGSDDVKAADWSQLSHNLKELDKRCNPKALKGRVDITLVQSNGAPANRKLLGDRGVEVALMQGGTITDADEVPTLASLGAFFYEPLWLFRTRDGDACPASAASLNCLRGKKIAIGPVDSGTRQLVSLLLEDHKIPETPDTVLPLDTKAAVKALQDRTVYAAFFSTSAIAEAVTELAEDPRVELLDYGPEVGGIERRFPELRLQKVMVLRNVISASENQPPSDMTMVATRAEVIVRKDLEFTIQYRLLKALKQIHTNSGLVTAPDEFPFWKTTMVPLSPAAQEFYNPDWFYEVNSFVADLSLPLWIDELTIQALHSWVVRAAISVLGVLSLPLFYRLAIVFFNWWRERLVRKLRERINRLEEELKKMLEELKKLKHRVDREHAEQISGELDELDQQAGDLLRRGGVHIDHQVDVQQKRIKALRQKLQQYVDSKLEGPDDAESTGP